MTTAPRPLNLSANYRAYVRGVRELHKLALAGKDDSPEADAIRDATDLPCEGMSDAERERAGNLSEDLYSLAESTPPVQPMTAEAQARLAAVYEAKRNGECDKALDLLRRWCACFDPALVSSLRGSIWQEAGDPETAALFFEHASKLDPVTKKGTA